MNYRSVFYVLGKIMNILALLMLLPLFVSFYYNMQGFKEAKYISFIIPIVLLFLLGMILKCFNGGNTSRKQHVIKSSICIL